jgi:hypothetical protein
MRKAVMRVDGDFFDGSGNIAKHGLHNPAVNGVYFAYSTSGLSPGGLFDGK